MLFMNYWEIRDALARYGDHPVLGPAVQTLVNLEEAVNANSDGWPYWRQPVRAAAQLMTLIGTTRTFLDDALRVDVTHAQVRKALVPVKAFRTRSGLEFTIEEA